MLKQIVLNQITLCADGSLGLQWLKQLVDDDGSIIFSEPHRSIVDFDASDLSQIDDVSAHLTAMGYPAVDTEQINRIRAVDAIGRGDAKIEAVRRAKIEAKEAAAAEVAAAEAAAAAAALLAAEQAAAEAGPEA